MLLLYLFADVCEGWRSATIALIVTGVIIILLIAVIVVIIYWKKLRGIKDPR